MPYANPFLSFDFTENIINKYHNLNHITLDHFESKQIHNGESYRQLYLSQSTRYWYWRLEYHLDHDINGIHTFKMHLKLDLIEEQNKYCKWILSLIFNNINIENVRLLAIDHKVFQTTLNEDEVYDSVLNNILIIMTDLANAKYNKTIYGLIGLNVTYINGHDLRRKPNLLPSVPNTNPDSNSNQETKEVSNIELNEFDSDNEPENEIKDVS